ncbi:MAG: thioredoxin domain-containing protein [Alphaproteobacteria bacterium]|nr:thioredoxin domain-containing protein [Alphaproteobacteria bacterium]
MFKKKKSPLPALLALLLFIAVALAGWKFFSTQETGPATTSDQIETTEQETPEHDNHGATDHTHDHDHEGHTHDTANTSAANQSVGEKGNVVDIPVDPVLGRRAMGDPNAPVQIREYYSLTCNHCATFHTGTFQALKAKYIDTGKAYFIFEEFPLNGPALYGAMIARCMPLERYDAFHSMLLKTQDQWAFSGNFKESLKQNAKLAGMSDEEFDSCFNNEQLQKAMASNISKASEAWEISSTPTFIFNNGERILRGVRPIEDFDTVIADLTADTGDTDETANAPDSAELELELDETTGTTDTTTTPVE